MIVLRSNMLPYSLSSKKLAALLAAVIIAATAADAFVAPNYQVDVATLSHCVFFASCACCCDECVSRVYFIIIKFDTLVMIKTYTLL